jgi:hypothetical protein
LQHREKAAGHDFGGRRCGLYERLYVLVAARGAHMNGVTKHNLCRWCSFDGKTTVAQRAHEEQVHYVCRYCEMELDNANNLQEVRFSVVSSHITYRELTLRSTSEHISLQPSNILGHGCYRKFSEFSATLIHLESSTCSSQIHRESIMRALQMNRGTKTLLAKSTSESDHVLECLSYEGRCYSTSAQC